MEESCWAITNAARQLCCSVPFRKFSCSVSREDCVQESFCHVYSFSLLDITDRYCVISLWFCKLCLQILNICQGNISSYSSSFLAQQTNAGGGHFITEVSRSRTVTHHSR